MRKSDIVLYVVRKLNEIGSWTGNTHIQKIIYLTQSACNLKLYNFVLYHYGPYSFDLREDLDFLAISGYLERSADELGYHYKAHINSELQIPAEIKEKVDKIAKIFGKAPTTLLELITTVDYIMRKYPSRNDEEITETVRKIKPHFSERAIKLAIKWIKEDFKKILDQT